MAKTVDTLKVSLPLDKASIIVDATLAAAREHDLEPLTVAVLDSGGHVVVLKREDGSGIIRVEIARAKAYGALGMGISSRGIGERLGKRPIFATSLTVISPGGLTVAAGGVLIKDAAGRSSVPLASPGIRLRRTSSPRFSASRLPGLPRFRPSPTRTGRAEREPREANEPLNRGPWRLNKYESYSAAGADRPVKISRS